MNKLEKEAAVAKKTIRAVAHVITEALAYTKTSEGALADRLGVPVLYIKQLIAAEERPTVVMLAQIANALGLELRMGFFEPETKHET